MQDDSFQRGLEVGKEISGDLFSLSYIKNKIEKNKRFDEMAQNAQDTFEKFKSIYEDGKGIVEAMDESSLEEEFIKPFLDALDHIYDVQVPIYSPKGIEGKPDYVFFPNRKTKNEAKKIRKKKSTNDSYFKRSYALLDAKNWRKDLDIDDTLQIKKYLKITEVRWGVLTNGRQWRLYCRDTDYSSVKFLEFNLKNILEHNDKETFKYFYALFSYDSFVESEERNFLDIIYEKR